MRIRLAVVALMVTWSWSCMSAFAESPVRLQATTSTNDLSDLDQLINEAGKEIDQETRKASYTTTQPFSSYEVVGSGGCDSCATGGCDSCGTGACTSCSSGSTCSTCPSCKPSGRYAHRTGVFGEYLYLQASGADVAYGQPRDGLDPNTSVPVGGVGVANPGYSSGARLGGSFALDDNTSIVATYTWYESSTSDAIATNVPNSIHSLATYPGTFTAASNSLFANAQYDIDFQLADLDYRSRLFRSNKTVVNYIVGARYGNLDQQFSSTQPAAPGQTTVQTDTGFDGYGIRLGLDGERQCCGSGIFLYGRGSASFLVGTYNSTYVQTNTFATVQAQTSWTDDRITPILEYELGLGWQNRSGNIRFSAGYYMAAWMNAVTTPAWIDAAQADNFTDVEDTITFDGLTARVQVGW